MSYSTPFVCPAQPQPGFVFDHNISRNARLLEEEGYSPPKAVKTGTTIVGVVFKDGVVLGADSRATDAPIICDKVCDKIHYLQPNIYCCGAGTAADAQQTSHMVSAELTLHQFFLNRPVVPVCTATQVIKQYLFRFKGHVAAAFIIGGVDSTGPQLFCVYPHGSSDHLPYASMGSGSLSAIAATELRWEPGLEEEQAVELVRDAIKAGIYNDLGSGSNVDICIIKKDCPVDHRKAFDVVEKKSVPNFKYSHRKGTTAILSTRIKKLSGHHGDAEEDDIPEGIV